MEQGMGLGMVGVGVVGMGAGMHAMGRLERRQNIHAAAAKELALANNRPGIPESSSFWERSASFLDGGQVQRTSRKILPQEQLRSMVVAPLREAARMQPAAGHSYLSALTHSYDVTAFSSGRLASRMMIPTMAAGMLAVTGVIALAER